jgi:hypothetical protein
MLVHPKIRASLKIAKNAQSQTCGAQCTIGYIAAPRFDLGHFWQFLEAPINNYSALYENFVISA